MVKPEPYSSGRFTYTWTNTLAPKIFTVEALERGSKIQQALDIYQNTYGLAYHLLHGHQNAAVTASIPLIAGPYIHKANEKFIQAVAALYRARDGPQIYRDEKIRPQKIQGHA